MVNFKTITRIIGILLLLETAMLLACSGISLYYQDEALTDFWKSAGIAAGVGILLVLLGKGSDGVLTRRDGYVLVSLAWIAFSFFGMLPFYISGYIPDITNAFFETMSGFTSTGATILDNIESLPHGLLFWRSMTQWIGGLGIIMFTIAVLPIFGVSGLQVFAAEASGPTHDKVHPRIGITAKWIWSVYTGITATLVGLLMLGGEMVFLVSNTVHRNNSNHPLLYQPDGCGRSFPQIAVSGHQSSYVNRFCYRRLYAMAIGHLGVADNRHGDRSLRRQYHRRSEVHPSGHSEQSVEKRI